MSKLTLTDKSAVNTEKCEKSQIIIYYQELKLCDIQKFESPLAI